MTTEWSLDQQNRVDFVMVDSTYTEVVGLGSGFTVEISKNAAAFAASAGVKAEIGSGWYSYLSTTGEADTIGPVALRVTGAGSLQQNLEYVVKQRPPGAVAFTYTVTNSITLLPEEGTVVWISTDIGGNRIIVNGLLTDIFGVARDANGNLPYLQPGTYYIWKHKQGYISDQNPDTEVVI